MTSSEVVIAHDSGKCGRPKRDGSGPCTRPAGWGTAHVGQGACKLHGGNNIVKHGRFSTIKREELRALIEHHAANPDPLNILREVSIVRALLDDYINRYDEWREALLAWHRSYTAAERPVSEQRLLQLETVVDELEALVGPADLDEIEEGAEPQPHGGWLRRQHAPDEDDEGSRVRRAMRDARQLIKELREPAGDIKPRRILDLADAVGHAEAITRMVKRIEDVRAANAISRPDLLRLMAEMGRVVQHHVGDEAVLAAIKEDWLRLKVA